MTIARPSAEIIQLPPAETLQADDSNGKGLMCLIVGALMGGPFWIVGTLVVGAFK